MKTEQKYKIIRDDHVGGWQFDDKEFDTVDEAVKEGVENSYSTQFLVVQVIDWEAKQKDL